MAREDVVLPSGAQVGIQAAGSRCRASQHSLKQPWVLPNSVCNWPTCQLRHLTTASSPPKCHITCNAVLIADRHNAEAASSSAGCRSAAGLASPAYATFPQACAGRNVPERLLLVRGHSPAVVDAKALRGRGPRPGVEGAQRRGVRRRLVVAQAGQAVAEAAPAEPCASYMICT